MKAKAKRSEPGLHGLLLVDKPSGITSHDVVARARRCLGMKAVGHAGTLDPLATGLIVLLLGEATKLSDYVLNADKSYEVKVRLGLITDSLDITGRVLERREVNVSEETLNRAILDAQGELSLPVPAYSAVKVGGKKLYELARAEKLSSTPVRSMNFFNLKLVEFGQDCFSARVDCHKGGYIRSWVEFVGRNLGCGATVEELRRLGSGSFRVEKSLSLESLEELASLSKMEGRDQQACGAIDPRAFGDSFVSLNQALPQWKALTVKGRDEHLMVNGLVSHDLSRRLISERKRANNQRVIVPVKILSSATGQLLSLIEAMPEGGLKVRRIFQLPAL
ncbi:MAG: tRNA pseudouridine(55) synthase TruB [Bdellovibrionales bacterium]|nr:tRNA pseudouridine(55) synthase TruB [Bdellovibrionales bacterium]